MISVLSLTGTNIDGHDDLSLHQNVHDQMHSHTHEDEDDAHDGDSGGMSKAEMRKSNKPIMEKRRRARINTCLNELKSLILDALKKDPSRHSKLEKADILEMTVKHLQAVQRQQLAMAVANDPSVLEKFKGGFTECAQEITRYVSRIDGVDNGVRQRLQHHLSNCTNSLNATTPLSFTAMAGLPVNFANRRHVRPPPVPQGDVNNNHARLLHRLVAARLAAAGDTTGAALLLQGGLSLLARGGNVPPPRHMSHQYPPQRPNNHPKINMQVVNEGASSSRECASRVSAFTAVKRSASPPRIIDNPLKVNPALLQIVPKIIAPTAIRPIPCGEDQRKTLIQAQVSLQPVKTGEEISSPIDFSFRSGTKRPLEEPVLSTRPTKVLKVEAMIPVSSSSVSKDQQFSSSVQATSPLTIRTSPSVLKAEQYVPIPDNAEEEDKEDMWRPW